MVRRLMLTASIVVLCAGPAFSETLKQALSATYRYNPVIDSERARLRANDENVSLANAAFRPKVTANGSIGWEHTIIGQGGQGQVLGPSGILTSGGAQRISGYGFGLTQPLFTGGQLTHRLESAEANVRAGRETLRDTERGVFMQAVIAYTDVLSASEVLKLQERNIDTLNKQLKSTKERLTFNELTNTDVSQTEARRAFALSQLSAARANLKTARANYLQVVGNEPHDLVEPSLPQKLLPKTLNEAIAIASKENPLVINALYNEESARHQVDAVRAQLLPQISLNAGWGDLYRSQGAPYERSGSVFGRLTLPLYDGGTINAQVRQAKETHVSTIQNIETARSGTQRNVTAAWLQMEAARQQVDNNNTAIKATRAALDGVRKEEAIGQRTFLDVLNAEQDVLAAQVALATARRNLVVASYGLIAQIGRLEADQLELASDVYDPTVHYEEVRRKWFGLSITHADGRREFVDASPEKAPMK